MCCNYFQQHEVPADAFDQWLAQLLADIPEFLPTQIGIPSVLPPPPPSKSPSAPPPSAHHAPNPHLTCQWVTARDIPLICGAPLSQDPKHACAHFRHVHEVRGNEKVIVSCHWRDCQVPPMQRGSLIRHMLSVHLGLLRWQCNVCGRWFSRKGTGHACVASTEGE